MKIWDIKTPEKNVLNFRAHELEILTCDFNKYNETIVTGSIDKSIRIWVLNIKIKIKEFEKS